MIPPPSQSTEGVCNQITFLILYYISSRLVTLLKSLIQLYKSGIFEIIVSLNLIKFSFQILFFVPEMSASFTSYIV